MLALSACGGAGSTPAAGPSSASPTTFAVHGSIGLIGDVDGGLGTLGNGSRSNPEANCTWAFTVSDVPDTEGPAGIYGVTVSHRGTISFKRSDADDVELSIGS
jgi:hypothetical protein